LTITIHPPGQHDTIAAQAEAVLCATSNSPIPQTCGQSGNIELTMSIITPSNNNTITA